MSYMSVLGCSVMKYLYACIYTCNIAFNFSPGYSTAHRDTDRTETTSCHSE